MKLTRTRPSAGPTRLPFAATSLMAGLLLAGIAGTALAAPQITAADGTSVKKAIAAQKGKVVVVNLWATWCGPCVDEFPDLVKLHNNYKAKGASFISVSVDEPEDKSKVVKFIADQKATFPVYTRSKQEVESFIKPLDGAWSGAVPTTYIYDKSGKLVGKPIVGSRSYAEFAKLVDAALKR